MESIALTTLESARHWGRWSATLTLRDYFRVARQPEIMSQTPLLRRFRCRRLGDRDTSVLPAHRGLHRILALAPRLGVFIGVLRNNLRDVQDVEDFSANRALASPGPCVAAYRARLVLDLSQVVDSMISVFLGSRIVIEEAGSGPFRAVDGVSVSAGQAESAGCPPAFVCATDFHRR